MDEARLPAVEDEALALLVVKGEAQTLVMEIIEPCAVEAGGVVVGNLICDFA